MVEALQPTRMSDEERLTRPIDRGAPGDAAIFSVGKTPERRELNRRKSAFYSDAFAQRESNNTARERVGRDSVVMAEVRTNVIVSRSSLRFQTNFKNSSKLCFYLKFLELLKIGIEFRENDKDWLY